MIGVNDVWHEFSYNNGVDWEKLGDVGGEEAPTTPDDNEKPDDNENEDDVEESEYLLDTTEPHDEQLTIDA